MRSSEDTNLIDDIASLFGGKSLSNEELQASGEFVDLMYKPMESIFGAVAQNMVKAGWSIFPQELDGNRRPGTVDGEMIKWSDRYDLANRKPPLKDLKRWMEQCSNLNVAVVLGPASGNAVVIDVDVVEEDLSAQIQELAVKHFGQTPLRRVGRWPKIALVYRQSVEDTISGRSPKFAKIDHQQNPDKLDQGLEIISSGQAMTFYGKHHKTGRYFTWLQDTPDTVGPESCPVITSEQVGNFLDEVDALRQFNKSQSLEEFAVSWEWDDTKDIHVPRIRPSGAATSWTENEDGIVTDGREAYLRDLTFRVVRANPAVVIVDGDVSELGVKKLTDIVVQRFQAHAEMSGKWKGKSLEREAKERVKRVAQNIKSGKVRPNIPKTDDNGRHIKAVASRAYLPPQPRKTDGDSLDFLPPFVDPSKASFDPTAVNQRRPLRIEIVEATPEEVENRRKERAIEEDRTNIANAVSAGLMKAFGEFWDEVYDPLRTETRVHILKAPTGAGKTSRGMRFISEDPRTKQDYIIRGTNGEIVSEGRNPILVLMPTYTNIEELKEKADIYNLDPMLPDDQLKYQALEAGLIHEDDLEEKLHDIRSNAKNAGVETMLYQGKLRAGCKMQEKVQLAMSAGIGTSTLCHTPEEKDKDGNVTKPEKFCPFYHQHHIDEKTGEYAKCPAIDQKDNIQKSHVVFMPHAFLALNIPEELQHVRAVVADERIHHLFLHTSTFERDVFVSPRKPPRLTKKEREQGLDPNEFHAERMAAVGMINLALQQEKKVDLAAYMLTNNKGFDQEKGEPLVLRWVRSAIRTCGASMERDATIDPDISIEDLMEICAQPTGKSVREEWRFWKIIEERLEILIKERPLAEMMIAQGKTPPPTAAKGRYDHRIQLVEDLDEKGLTSQHIRISWRTTPNWVDRPLLLLDASAAPAMISKIWKGKDVQVHDIPAALNVRIASVIDRTYSNASVVAKPNATHNEKVESGRLLANVRKAISTVSALYGWSRVVAGGSIIARRAVNTQWEGPHNVDWCHYGAMRGLDFAKWHAAAISVGRMELPIRTIDGLVAALTYDDDDPETPYDEFGTGLNKLGQPLMVPTGVQTVKMRSGHDLLMPVPMYPGIWGRMIQKQYREEELLQFLGRVRPVYREGMAPIWFSLSSVIPEEVIVDDLITIEDLLRRGKSETSTFEIMRRCQGILDMELALAVCDDLYSSAKVVARHMKNDGFDWETGKISARASWGIVSYKWIDEEGEEGYSFVRADITNPEDALRNAFHEHLGKRLISISKMSKPLPPTMARGRKSDKIEDELGTLDARRSDEQKHAADVAEFIIMNSPAEALEALREDRKEKTLPVTLPSGINKDASNTNATEYKVNLREIESRLTIENLWKKLGWSDSKIASKMVDIGMTAPETAHEDALGDYSAAAEHTNDAVTEWGEADDFNIPF